MWALRVSTSAAESSPDPSMMVHTISLFHQVMLFFFEAFESLLRNIFMVLCEILIAEAKKVSLIIILKRKNLINIYFPHT